MIKIDSKIQLKKNNSFLNRKFVTLCAILISTNAMPNSHTTADPFRKNSCFKGSFSEFFKSFIENEKVQRLSTKNPLSIQRIDPTTEPEPTPVIKVLNAQQITFPLILRKIDRENRRLLPGIDKQSEKKANITLYRDNSGYLINFFFLKKKCWVLEKIEDDSI